MTTLHTSVHPPVAAADGRGVRTWLQAHPLLGYTLLSYGWSWVGMVGLVVALQFALLPADSPSLGLINQVAAFVPAVAACLVIALTQGRPGLGLWLRSLVRWRVGVQWYLFALFGIPLLMLLEPTGRQPARRH